MKAQGGKYPAENRGSPQMPLPFSPVFLAMCLPVGAHFSAHLE
jgi:hypothetical protein